MKSHHSITKAKQKASQLLQAHKLEEAWHAFERISRHAPADHEVWLNMGAIAAMQRWYERAERALRRALQLRPDLPQANVNLARVLMLQERAADALPYLERYLSLRPDDLAACVQLGALYEAQRSREFAEGFYRKALEQGMRDVDLYLGLSRLLRGRGALEEALGHCQQALQMEPQAPMAHLELGQLYLVMQRFDEAQACFTRVGELAANASNRAQLEVYHVLCLCLLYIYQERYDEALACHRDFLASHADAVDVHWDQALLLLLTGRLQEGFAEYEWRGRARFWLDQMQTGSFAQPRWQGEPLAGKTLLIYAEQGFGDSIQFGRYLPLLRDQGARVIFHCQPPLLGLFSRMEGIEVVARDYDKVRRSRFDFHLPLMSVAHCMGTALETIPAAIPYLKPDGDKVAQWRERIGRDRFSVGLVWAGSTIHPRNQARSITLEQLAPLADLPGIAWYGLQKEGIPEGMAPFAERLGLIDLSASIADFDDTAAIVENLDLVISVDSAVAHLAGSLGRPVWTLVYFPYEWRWLLGRDDSPWYPTMRLFRQGSSEPHWGPTIERVAAALRECVAGRGEGD